MGLQNSQSTSVFLQIANGKIVRQFKQATEKSVSRINKLGREVYEEFYDSLQGNIKDIKIRESEYGKSWQVTMSDSVGQYIIDIKYSSGYAVSFLKALPNVVFSEPVILTPRLNIEGDKKQSVLFISQNGKGLKHFWTKDNPKELPQMKKIKVKGVETWDDTERMEYLEIYVKDNILPKINPIITDNNDDDIPF